MSMKDLRLKDLPLTDLALTDLALKSRAGGLCVAVIMVAAFSVLPANADTKREQRYYAQQRYDAQPRSQGQYGGGGGTLSLDGRNTGQPRTCGFDYFQYDHRGATMGPYCH
jgi:hypothetical protein